MEHNSLFKHSMLINEKYLLKRKKDIFKFQPNLNEKFLICDVKYKFRAELFDK